MRTSKSGGESTLATNRCAHLSSASHFHEMPASIFLLREPWTVWVWRVAAVQRVVHRPAVHIRSRATTVDAADSDLDGGAKLERIEKDGGAQRGRQRD